MPLGHTRGHFLSPYTQKYLLVNSLQKICFKPISKSHLEIISILFNTFNPYFVDVIETRAKNHETSKDEPLYGYF